MNPSIDCIILKELSEAIKASDKHAFDVLFKAEYENVKFFINYYVKDSATAEDLAQDTFISLWNTRDRIDSSFNILSYVFKIAKNKSLNHLGTMKRKMTDSLDQYEIELTINALNDEYTTSKIDTLSIENIIHVTYEKLPQLTRKIFKMSREEDMTYDEIAKELDISIKKVEYNVTKALSVFRKRLFYFR